VAEKVLPSIAEPYDLDGHGVTVSSSIGTAVFPIDAGDDDTLLRRVDQAMYAAKKAGGGRHCRYGSQHTKD